MRRIISALLISISSSLVLAPALAQGSKPLELAEGAPARHIVVPGDTLWGISAKFLKDPYRWGELWKLNPEEIKNPHRIYPGQVVVLDKSSGEPRLKLETVREQRREYVEPLKKGIPTIPAQDIEPFLSEPRVIDMVSLEAATRVVALQDDRVIAGAGDTVYTTVPKETAKTWQVFRPGRPLLDPDTKEVLGHEARYLGTARLARKGEPTSFVLTTTKEEIVRDDRLLPSPRQDVINYVPRAPEKMIQAKVLAIYSGVNFTGPQSVLTINKGKVDGLELGHVLSTDTAGASVDNRYKGEKTTYKLPDQRNGLLFVFRVFDRVSYALVMNANKPIAVGDTVHTP